MIRPALSLRLALAFFVAALPAAARGGDTLSTPNATVRLLDGGEMTPGRLAGVAFTLAPGWKTYWRVPGDTGVPPEFDWSGSTNVAKAEVLWPAPQRLSDGQGGEVIGYEDGVVFPVKITPVEAGKPVELALKLHYAVCHDICLPGEAVLDRRMEDGPDRARIEEALALVPAAEPVGTISVADASLDNGAGGAMLRLDLKGAAVSPSTEIFVEGPSTAYFGAPADAGALPDGAGRRFTLPVSVTGNAAALRGAGVTLTILQGETRLVRHATIR